MHKLSYKTLFIIFFFLLIGIVILLRFVFPNQKVSAAWWNDGWMYRKAISVGNTGSNQTNIQIKILDNYDLSSFVTAGKIQSSLNDIRFTDINGNLLNYWIEDSTNNSVDIWGIIPSLPNGGATIYLYYGNPSAASASSTSNITIGGTMTSVSGYRIHTFKGNSTLTNAKAENAEVLVVAGGGGGGSSTGIGGGGAGGGGAGGLTYNASYALTQNQIINVTVGLGGTAGATSGNISGSNGGNSIFDTITTTGGGGGASTFANGNSGGSGGGAGYGGYSIIYYGGSGIAGIGNTGGNTSELSWAGGAGGGGASGAGGNNKINHEGGDGGLGTNYSITGVGVTYAIGGRGGGGAGPAASPANTGKGGDGAYSNATPADGASGIVVVRYLSATAGTPATEELSPGPVAYWKFDEGVGTTAYDSSSNRNNGSISGATWTSEDQCISGKCLFFNGSSYVNITNNNSVNLSDNFTVDIWIKGFTPSGAWDTIIAKENWNAGSGWFMYVENGNLHFNTNSSGRITITNPLSDTKWHLISVSISSGNAILYVDGKNKGSANSPITPNSGNLYIGSRHANDGSGNVDYIRTFIDDVKIYPYARTAAQIKQDYNSLGSKKGSSVNLGSNKDNTGILNNGLVGYWKMDETTMGNGTTFTDSSGNSNTGTGVSSVATTTGKFSNGVDIPGSGGSGNGSVINVSDSNSLDIGYTSPLTISFWINNDSTTCGAIIKKNGLWEIYRCADFLTIRFDGYDRNSSTNLTNGLWYFVTVTRNPTTNTTKVYINGQLSDEWTYTISNSPDYSGSMGIGAYNGGAWSVDSKLDEVRIYNRLLSPNEILQLYNWSPGISSLKTPISYYKFDEGNGSTTKNSISNNYNLSFAGEILPTWKTNGKVNKALYFYGVGTTNRGYLTTTSLNIGSTGVLTFSFWVNPDSSQNSNGMFMRNGLGADQNYALSLGSPSSSKYKIYVDRFNGSWETTNSTNYLIPVSEWSHVTIVLTEGSNWKYYLNGKYIETISISGTAANSTSALAIGGHNGANGQYFNGYLDEFKIYNTALTADEVKQDYNQGSATQMGQTNQTIGGTTTSLNYCIPGDTSNCSPPIAEYNFEENIGSTAYDTSGNNKNGTLNNTYNWTSGKTGSAISFNSGASANSMTTSSGVLTSSSGVLTLEASVYPTSYGAEEMTVVMGNYSYYLSVNADGSINCYWYGTSPAGYHSSGAGTVPLNRWTHITCSWDASNIRLYTNGVLKNTVSVTGTGATDTYIVIGAETTDRQFKGKIDNVKIYNYGRTPAQVAYDYNKGAPVGWWKLDECQGLTAFDSSGLGNTGTIVVGGSGSQNSLGTCNVGTSAAWTNGASGKVNSSLNFDGTDDYFYTGTVPTSSSYAISLWFKSLNVVDQARLFWGRGSNKGILAFSGTNGNLTWYAQTDTQTAGYTTTNSRFNLNQWNHVVLQYTGSQVECYINGVKDSNTTNLTGNSLSSAFNFGTNYNQTDNWFNGKLDDIRIFNYSLTPTQIKTLYNGGSVNFN